MKPMKSKVFIRYQRKSSQMMRKINPILIYAMGNTSGSNTTVRFPSPQKIQKLIEDNHKISKALLKDISLAQ
jgi:hypothetical protein